MLSATWIEFDTSAGNFVIQRGHAPMILSLDKKPIKVLLANGKHDAIRAAQGGIAEINRETVKLFLDE